MKYIIVLFALLTTELTAQDFFQRTYGGPGSEFGRGVIQTSDGGYACVGATNSYADGSSNVYLIKVDAEGNYLWGRNIGGIATIEWGMDIVQDSEGNLIIAGYTNNTANTGYDGLLIKLTPTGETIWQKNFGGADWDFFETLDIDSNNDLYIVGNTFRENSQKGWILKLDENGEQLWEETLTGSGNIYLTGVSICNDENIGFVGYSENQLTQTRSFLSGLIANSGTQSWISVNSVWGDITSGKCSCNSNGQLISIGTFHEPDDDDIYIVIQDIEFGLEELNTRIESPMDVSALGIDHRIDNKIAIVGWGEFIYFEGIDGYGAVRDENGQYISSDFTIGFGFTGTEIMYDCFHTSDGGYVAVGESNSYGNNYQLLLAKVGVNGNSTKDNEDFLDLATVTNGENKEKEATLYPNPSQSFIHIQSDRKISSFSIYNLNGAVIMEVNDLQKNPEKIDLSGFNTGIYFLQVEYSDQRISTHKVIKY